MKLLSIYRKGLIQIHIAVFLFGFAGLFGKFLSCDPLFIVFGRTFFAAIALLIFAKTAALPSLNLPDPRLKIYMILQGILLALHWWTFFVSIRVSSVAIGLITFSTFPLFVTFMEPVFFKEKLNLSDIYTATLVFAGIVLVIPELNLDHDITKGCLFGITSGFTFALLALVNRKNASQCHAVAVAFYQNLFAAIFLLIPLIVFNIPMPVWEDIPKLIFLGVICTAVSHTLFIGALTSIRAQTASVIAGLEPVYGIILAFLILDEQPQIKTISGGILIIGSTIAAGFLDYHRKK